MPSGVKAIAWSLIVQGSGFIAVSLYSFFPRYFTNPRDLSWMVLWIGFPFFYVWLGVKLLSLRRWAYPASIAMILFEIPLCFSLGVFVFVKPSTQRSLLDEIYGYGFMIGGTLWAVILLALICSASVRGAFSDLRSSDDLRSGNPQLPDNPHRLK